MRLSSVVARSPKASSDARSADSLSRSFAASACDLWNSLISLAQQIEILPRLLERLVLRDGAAADLVDLRQALAERFEHALLARHLVGLRHQGLEVLAHRVGLGVHGRQQLVFREHAVHARFGFGDARRQAAQPVIEGVEFLLVDRQPLDRRPEVLGQHAAFLVEPGELARELLARRGGRRQFGMRLFGQLLHARHGVFGPRHLLAALVELGDLHVHRPHHLVEAVGLDDGALDGVLLGLERLGLLRDVLGEGVERGETLFGVLAELLELHQRPELLLDFLHRLGRRRRIFPGLARGLADALELVGQLAADGADGVELALERRHAFHRLRDFRGGRPQQHAQVVVGRLLFSECFNRGLGFERLRRQLVHGQPMLLQVAVRRRDLFRHALGFVHLFEQAADPRLDLLEALGALVVPGDLLAELVELFQRELGFLADLVERLAGLGELRGAARHLREHRAQRRALVARLGDEGLQFVLLLFLVGAGGVAEKCVKHGAEYIAPVKRRLRVQTDWRLEGLGLKGLRASSRFAICPGLSTDQFLRCDRSSFPESGRFPAIRPRAVRLALRCTCSPPWKVPPSSESMPVRCTSRSTSATASPTTSWSGCPTRACARAAIGSAPRFATPASTSLPSGSPSTSRRVTSGRRDRRSTCPLPWACWPRPAPSRDPISAASCLIGELSLDGSIQPARGVLPIAAEARRHGARALLLPYDNLTEAAVVSGLRLLPVRTLREAVERMNQPAESWPECRGGSFVRRSAKRGGGARGAKADRLQNHISISPTFTARRSRAARWRSPPPAGTTC